MLTIGGAEQLKQSVPQPDATVDEGFLRLRLRINNVLLPTTTTVLIADGQANFAVVVPASRSHCARKIVKHLPCILMAFGLALSAPGRSVLSTNTTWKYFKGTSEASLPDTTAWRQIVFNDSSWLTGRAPFYRK